MMMTRCPLLLLLIAVSFAAGCQSPSSPDPAHPLAMVHYLEIVTEDVDATCRLYERMHTLSFGEPDVDLGQARVAEAPGGGLIGVRQPLAAHEKPTVRTYLRVDDIAAAVHTAEQCGAVVAYPPTQQGERGTFAIVILAGVEHGLWQR